MAEAAAKTKGTDVTKPSYSESIKGRDFKIAEAMRNTFEIFVDDETPIQLLATDQNYWAPIADKLTARDLLYVQPRSGGWLAIFRVLFADRAARVCQVAMLQEFKLPPVQPYLNLGLAPGWKVEWLDHARQFGALRDGEVKRDGFATGKDAIEYINTHATNR